MPVVRSRRWAMTLNNYEEGYEAGLKDLVSSLPGVSYMICGLEVGESGTPHLQAYIELSKRSTISGLKTQLQCNAWHLEKAGGNADQNIKYCKKDGNFWTVGAPMQQGRRSDLDRIRQDIMDGASLREIANDNFSQWVVYRRSFEAFIAMQVKPVPIPTGPFKWPYLDNIASVVLWGDAGIGKTEFAKFLLSPAPLFVTHIDDLRMFDSSVHSGIIFDDMSFFHLPRESQIHLVDFDNPRSIHIRYGCATIPSGTRKIFTTNVFNGGIFLEDGAINRRVTKFHCN